MKITNGTNKYYEDKLRNFNKQLADFKSCPQCRSVIRRSTDVKLLTWGGDIFSPYSAETILKAQGEWPVKIIAKCPRCGCEWESEEF